MALKPVYLFRTLWKGRDQREGRVNTMTLGLRNQTVLKGCDLGQWPRGLALRKMQISSETGRQMVGIGEGVDRGKHVDTQLVGMKGCPGTLV